MPSVALVIAPDHPAFAGHFPGQPIVPGVVLLDRAQAAIEASTSLCLTGLAMAKFLSPVRPGEPLVLQYEPNETSVRFSIQSGERAVANGRFQAGAARG